MLRRKKVDEGDRLPKAVSADCQGEACAYFTGEPCKSYEDLLNADGKSGGPDLPPLRSDANYALYGQVCLGGEKPQLVAQRAELLTERANVLQIIALSGRYGDMPLLIQDQGHETTVIPVVSSE